MIMNLNLLRGQTMQFDSPWFFLAEHLLPLERDGYLFSIFSGRHRPYGAIVLAGDVNGRPMIAVRLQLSDTRTAHWFFVT